MEDVHLLESKQSRKGQVSFLCVVDFKLMWIFTMYCWNCFLLISQILLKNNQFSGCVKCISLIRR